MTLYLWSRESGGFFSHCREGSCPYYFYLDRAGTPEEGSSSDFESEEFPASRDQLKVRVYSLLREKAHVPFTSPPRIQKTLSTFETSCGLFQELSSSYNFFPEPKHVSTAFSSDSG